MQDITADITRLTKVTHASGVKDAANIVALHALRYADKNDSRTARILVDLAKELLDCASRELDEASKS